MGGYDAPIGEVKSEKSKFKINSEFWNFRTSFMEDLRFFAALRMTDILLLDSRLHGNDKVLCRNFFPPSLMQNFSYGGRLVLKLARDFLVQDMP